MKDHVEYVDPNLKGGIDVPEAIKKEIRKTRKKKQKKLSLRLDAFDAQEHVDKCVEHQCCKGGCLSKIPNRVLVHHAEKWHGFSRKQKTGAVFDFLLQMHAKRNTKVRETLRNGVRVSKKTGQKRVLTEREKENVQNSKVEYYLSDPKNAKNEYPVCLKDLGKLTESFGGSTVTAFNDMLSKGNTEHYNDLIWERKARNNTKTHTVIMWVEVQKSVMADAMPTENNKQWLPYDTWSNAYVSYKQAVEVDKMFADMGVTVAASKSLFRKTAKKYFSPDVKMEKRYNTFTKCNICSDYKILIKKLGPQSKAGQVWVKHYQRHLWWTAANRMKYHHHRTKAKCFPDKYLSFIFDGSDNHAFEVPVFGDKRKDWKGASKPQSRTAGILVHSGDGQTGGLYLYLTDERTKKGTNFWITCILHMLNREAEKRGGKLPPFWYVQMDSAGDNKSKTMASFFEWCVKSGACYKIKNSMLSPGHTHEDIDASFGRLNRSVLECGLVTVTLEQALVQARKAFQHTNSILYIKVTMIDAWYAIWPR